MRHPPANYTDDMKREWRCEYETRLGMICGNDFAPRWAEDIAAKEATEHCEALIEAANPQPTLL